MKIRAVILEDEPMVRRMLQSLLNGRGYEVLSFPDPAFCPLDSVPNCPCPPGVRCADMIITDVNMFKSNAVDFVENLIQKGCRLPHIAMISGAFSETDVTRARRLGCALFPKPLDFRQIVNWLAEVERSIDSERVLLDLNKLKQPV